MKKISALLSLICSELFRPQIERTLGTVRNRKYQNFKRSLRTYERRLFMESLEERALLSVSPTDYEQTIADFETSETPSTVVTTTADLIDATDGEISLREAISYAGTNGLGSDITFDIAEANPTIALSSTLTIDRDLTINGTNTNALGGKIILDGGDKYDPDGVNGTTITEHSGVQIMIVDSNITVSFSNLTFQHGYLSSYGGAIFNGQDSTVSIVNSVFSGNCATKDGGAIYNSGKLSVVDSTFTGNSADNGGAIYNGYGKTLSVVNSTFNENSTVYNHYGGAIYTRNTLNVSDSTFTGNSANAGGAIYADETGMSSVVNSTFNENNATPAAARFTTAAR